MIDPRKLAECRSLIVSRAHSGDFRNDTPVARVAMHRRRAALEWTAEALVRGIRIDPLHYRLTTGLIQARTDYFGGLHGFLSDSLPDAWGLRLMRRQLRRAQINLSDLTPIQMLSLIGRQGRGALVFFPENFEANYADFSDFDALARAAQLVLEDDQSDQNNPVDVILQQLGSGSGGARPKAHVRLEGSDWIIKFPGPTDPSDIGPIEYAYMLMAKAAGLQIAEPRLLAAKSGPGYFATKRFDRIGDGRRIHMLTLCAVLEAPSGETALGYEALLRTTLQLTRDMEAVEQAYRRMVFNILAHNRDDHSRQHSFLQTDEGEWRLSPAYDLTFSSGPGGEHEFDIVGEARNPTFAHIIQLAEKLSIQPVKVRHIVDEVRAAVADWSRFATQCGVAQASRKAIDLAITKVNRQFGSP